MFENILVCLDGSELAEQVLPYAIAEATGCSATKVVLLQVVSPPTSKAPPKLPVYAANLQEDLKALLDKERSEAKFYLEHMAEPLRKKGINVECAVPEGKAGETIVDYATKNKMGLIMIATHGRSGLSRIAFGSVADYVLKESHMPILLIKPK